MIANTFCYVYGNKQFTGDKCGDIKYNSVQVVNTQQAIKWDRKRNSDYTTILDLVH